MFPKPYFVTRKTGNYDVHGVWQGDNEITVNFMGSVQPADSDTIAAIPQGRENNGVIVIFSDTRLRTSMQDSQQAGDHLTYYDLDYEIVTESAFDSGLLPHFRYVAMARGPL